MTKRVRRSKADAANAPSRFDLEAEGQFAGLPFVLTAEAVRSDALPELGKSGMPTSLEAHVPVEFRYWNATTTEKALEVREALVESGMFAADLIAKVDGEHRLLVRRSYLAPTFEAKADAVLVDRANDLVVASSALVLDVDQPVAAMKIAPEELSELDADVTKSRWLVQLCAADEKTAAVVMGKLADSGVHAFELATRPGSIYVTNVPARKNASNVVPYGVPVTKRNVRLLAKADEVQAEEQFVLGIVLEPDVIDSQQDTYDAATIRAAAHGFMQFYRNVGLQHDAYVTGKIEILESYLAPVDMVIEGQTIKAGTWMMGLRFVDPKLWAKVKSGELTGLSIGGTALRDPEPNVGELAPA